MLVNPTMLLRPKVRVPGQVALYTPSFSFFFFDFMCAEHLLQPCPCCVALCCGVSFVGVFVASQLCVWLGWWGGQIDERVSYKLLYIVLNARHKLDFGP
jgi:hypothetical protein